MSHTWANQKRPNSSFITNVFFYLGDQLLYELSSHGILPPGLLIAEAPVSIDVPHEKVCIDFKGSFVC